MDDEDDDDEEGGEQAQDRGVAPLRATSLPLGALPLRGSNALIKAAQPMQMNEDGQDENADPRPNVVVAAGAHTGLV